MKVHLGVSFGFRLLAINALAPVLTLPNAKFDCFNAGFASSTTEDARSSLLAREVTPLGAADPTRGMRLGMLTPSKSVIVASLFSREVALAVAEGMEGVDLVRS